MAPQSAAAVAAKPAGPTIDPGPRPELTWLPVAMLSIDPAYQRTIDGRISQAAIARIVEKFRWSSFGVIVVTMAEEGGGWLIIDGQHRVEAARRCRLSTVPCVVVPAESQAEQAEIFLGLNRTRVPINPYAIHAARVAAGDAQAVATATLAREAGIEIPRYPIPRDKLGAGQTMALSTIAKAAESPCGSRAVRMVGQAWGKREGGIPAAVLRAAWQALETGVPAASINGWLARQEKVVGQLSSAVVGDLVNRMRRATPGASVVAGVDPRRLMGSR